MNLRRYHALSGVYLWVDAYRWWQMRRAWMIEAKKLKELLRARRAMRRQAEEAQRIYEQHQRFLASYTAVANQAHLAQISTQSLLQQQYLNNYMNMANGYNGQGSALGNLLGLGRIF